MFCSAELQALGEHSPLLIGLRSGDVFPEDLHDLITFPLSESGKIFDLPFCRLTVADGRDAGVYDGIEYVFTRILDIPILLCIVSVQYGSFLCVVLMRVHQSLE